MKRRLSSKKVQFLKVNDVNDKDIFSKWITIKEINNFTFPKANHKIFSILNNIGWNV